MKKGVFYRMKSRLQKNSLLHQTLSTNLENESVSKDLSVFANKLNEIDTQFRKLDYVDVNDHQPQRARIFESETIANDAPIFDTFENTYLKDFLNEVKEYNIKKGYRNQEDTQTHILGSLKNGTLPQAEAIRSVIEDDTYLNDYETFDNVELTPSSAFKSYDSLDEVLSTINSGNDESIKPDFLPKEDPIFDTSLHNSIEELTQELENLTSESNVIPYKEPSTSIDEENNDSTVEIESIPQPLNDTFKRELLEQTQTLQHKIIEQERHIEDMNDVMVHTNRLMNAVISLLLLAIFVVVVLVVSQIVLGN